MPIEYAETEKSRRLNESRIAQMWCVLRMLDHLCIHATRRDESKKSLRCSLGCNCAYISLHLYTNAHPEVSVILPEIKKTSYAFEWEKNFAN